MYLKKLKFAKENELDLEIINNGVNIRYNERRRNWKHY